MFCIVKGIIVLVFLISLAIPNVESGDDNCAENDASTDAYVENIINLNIILLLVYTVKWIMTIYRIRVYNNAYKNQAY